jgi:hypothetical protein
VSVNGAQKKTLKGKFSLLFCESTTTALFHHFKSRYTSVNVESQGQCSCGEFIFLQKVKKILELQIFLQSSMTDRKENAEKFHQQESLTVINGLLFDFSFLLRSRFWVNQTCNAN